MRPKVKFLDDDLIERIISEALALIRKLGVEINNDNVFSLLGDHGARIDREKKRAYYKQEMIDKSLKTVPESFKLYDSAGKEAVCLSGYNVNFTPGSAAINILDGKTDQIRLAYMTCNLLNLGIGQKVKRWFDRLSLQSRLGPERNMG